MKSRSLQIKGVSWKVSRLGEKALVLTPVAEGDPLAKIHSLVRLLEKIAFDNLADIIPAYDSIALVFNRPLKDEELPIQEIEQFAEKAAEASVKSSEVRIPVCYDHGLDWAEVERHTSLTRKEIIEKHTKGIYTLAMMGFLPGFLYLSGLDELIACPRRDNPRTKIPAGSVGIGGSQTGVYSLESPGGWQIIGRTPISFFDAEKVPPVPVNPGDIISFYAISAEEFETLSKKREGFI